MHGVVVVVVASVSLAGRAAAGGGGCEPLPDPTDLPPLPPVVRSAIFDVAASVVAELRVPREPEELNPDVFARSKGALRQVCELVQIIDGKVYVYQHSSGIARSWDMQCCQGHGCEAFEADGVAARLALRLQSMLRLVDYVARASARWQGKSFEFVLCGGDGPPHPISKRAIVVQTHSCSGSLSSPAVPFPDLSTFRHPPLARWTDLLSKAGQRTAAYAHAGNFTQKTPKLVFRGSMSDIKRTCANPSEKVVLNNATWRHRGTRLKLLALRAKRPDLFNVNLGKGNSLNQLKRLAKQYDIEELATLPLDHPNELSLLSQVSQYRYTIAIGRKFCWTEGLRYLLLQPTAVILQWPRPCQEWWVRMLVPNVHFIPVDPELNNLTDVIEWANENEATVERISLAANELIQSVFSPSGIYFYCERILDMLSAYFPGPPARLIGTQRFTCSNNTGQCMYGEIQHSGYFDQAS